MARAPVVHHRRSTLETRLSQAVARSPERIVRLFDEARQEYIPHAGVDHKFHQHAYVGYLRALE